ncbi:MAG: exosome complex RNA-binding protein Rrp4 [Candidatus Hydrothermarchaeota archaeon]
MKKTSHPRKIVVPGDILAEKWKNPPIYGTYLDGDKLCSSVVGVVEVKNDRVKIIPLQGKYIPREGDKVIGKIIEVRFSNWLVDVNAVYPVTMHVADVVSGKIDVQNTDIRKIYDVGDVVYGVISRIDELRRVSMSCKGKGLGKIRGGRLLTLTYAKVPRLIGRGGSMINLIREKMNLRYIIGQNGIIWVDGPDRDIELMANMINMIEKESHTTGLTDRVRAMLEESMESDSNG